MTQDERLLLLLLADAILALPVPPAYRKLIQSIRTIRDELHAEEFVRQQDNDDQHTSGRG